jgi:peptidoglycan/LPS O-acetylase OafA/YrhL
MQGKYLKHLNGLRAFAMLAVAMNHSLIVFSFDGNRRLYDYPPFSTLEHSGEIIIRTLMLLFANGFLAVTFFFTLSGFVLGLSLDRYSKDHFISYYGRFVIRRIFRLYPAHFIILILIVLYYNFLHQPLYSSVASQWFHLFSTLSGVTIKEFARNLIFVDSSLNSVTWVMKYQVTAVFILPFLHFLSRRLNLNNILVVGLLYYLGLIIELSILKYLYVFYLGLMLPNAKHCFQKINPNYKNIISLAVVIILILPRSSLLASVFSDEYRIVTGEAIGCFLLIGLLSYGQPLKVYNIFLWRCFQHLGKISYSFFLINFISLIIISTVLFNSLSEDSIQRFMPVLAVILSVSSISVSCVIASFISKYIEYPCIQYSNMFFPSKQNLTVTHKVMLIVLVAVIAISTVGTYFKSELYERKAMTHLIRGKAYQDKYSTLDQDKFLIENSIKHFQAALKLNPDLSEAYNNLGILYNAKGMYEKAIEHYKHALSLTPSSPDAHYNLGNVYMMKGLMHEAEEHYLKAITLKPDDPYIYDRLGITYIKMGLSEKAKEQFSIAKRLRDKKSK